MCIYMYMYAHMCMYYTSLIYIYIYVYVYVYIFWVLVGHHRKFTLTIVWLESDYRPTLSTQ